MAIFSKKKKLDANASQIPQIAEAIRKDFVVEGFEVHIDSLMSGGRDISVTKGNLFKAILGMKSALKISLTPQYDGVFFEAHVGIFGQQSIPTIISMFYFWPVLIPQIWGLIEQSSLDDRAIAAAERAIRNDKPSTAIGVSAFRDNGSVKFCTACGAQITASAKFCPECGNKA